jgi:hypothetical protein
VRLSGRVCDNAALNCDSLPDEATRGVISARSMDAWGNAPFAWNYGFRAVKTGLSP